MRLGVKFFQDFLQDMLALILANLTDDFFVIVPRRLHKMVTMAFVQVFLQLYCAHG